MDLASWMVVATIAVFAAGAAFGLAWSIASGQWSHLDEAARLVLDDEEEMCPPHNR